ncbi:MoaD/ThiS family protein [Desulfobacula sp.]|uniref:MoaD/ThiS family protein n=1 Tax=Desulfobacula sp. TaxID=2593537 RepID=UPI0026285E60|nr:MoaD/ThiS family protein [Desulfobacula sp.]
MTIRVTIRLFGTLSLKVPDYEHKKGLIVHLPDDATPEDLLKRLQLPPSHVGLISHENQAIQRNTRLKDGMTIGLFSPVYGG